MRFRKVYLKCQWCFTFLDVVAILSPSLTTSTPRTFMFRAQWWFRVIENLCQWDCRNAGHAEKPREEK